MTRTLVASAKKEVIIGFDQPFCVIGERINPTGRKKLAAEMVAGNFDTVRKDALEQVACGATMLDVNAGVTAVDPNATEPALLVQTLQIVQDLVDVPLSIDSSVTAAIEAALKVAKGRPLVNSVTGEEEKLEAILPLVKKYNVPVVAISNDETGISMDPDVRFAVAKKIVERAADHGIKAEDIVVDPLVMPIGALGDAGRQVFRLLRRLRDELKVNTTCGLSNISFGLPHRHGINAGFIPMVIGAGMTSAIMNPTRPQEMEAVRAANVLNGTDENCTNWIMTYRDYQPAAFGGAAPAAAPAAASGGRRGGREARRAAMQGAAGGGTTEGSGSGGS
jgi:5-methyltetrahydrofolate--homocysteine methyltransferase